MKKVFRFFRKKKKPPSDSGATDDEVTSAPIASAAALPSPSLTSISGYKVRSKELSELHLAAATGDLEKLQELSKKHDLNQCDEANRTPLHFACANGRIDVATFLVRKRCKLNICDNDNRTPLMKAVQCQQESCAVYLLNHGADCNLVDAHGNTALHLAASTSCIPIAQELLDNFADTDAQNKGGSTPLFLAVAENSKEMTEFLLANGADINARDYEGRTPLMMAISYGNRDLANLLLLHGAEIFLEDDAGRSAEDYALISGDLTLREKISESANLRKKEFSDRIKEALSIYGSPEDTGFMWGAPATNKEVVDDHSSGESLRSFGNPDDDSWLSSEEENLDFSPKKVQKRSTAQLMNISQLFKEKNTLALGMYEEEENGAESPWDSESISASPGKPIIGFLPASPAKASTHMRNISEEPCNGTSDGSQLKTTQANVEQGISASHLLKGTESKEKPESDTSDWDSPSVSLKSVPCRDVLVMEDHASLLQLAKRDSVSKMSETIPTKGEEMSDAQPITALTGPQCNEQVIQKVESGENKINEEKRKQKLEKWEAAGKEEDADTEKKLTVNPVEKSMEQMLTVNEKQDIKSEDKMVEDSQVNITSSVERKELIPVPFHGFTLKQEEEKSMSVEMLYEKAQEQLRKKEEQCCKQMEEKQQLVLMQRALEMKLKKEEEKRMSVEMLHEKTQEQLRKKEEQCCKQMEEKQQLVLMQRALEMKLKKAEEKRMSVEMLHEKTQEQLRKKEEQCCKQMEEKQQLEFMLKTLEMELRTLKAHLKEVEEERNETQRQLSQAQNARALQEGLLNTHCSREKELEEESKRKLSKSSEVADGLDQEKELLHKNKILQGVFGELSVLRLELDQLRVQHREEEAKYLEENDALKQENEELKKTLKMYEEALNQTVFQNNGQRNISEEESAMLSSKLKDIKENKERLEVELESFRFSLHSVIQELEQCQISKNNLEETVQRERDEWLHLKDRLNHDLRNLRETNNAMSQQLSKAESHANILENELHHVTHTLQEKNFLLESIQRDLSQAQSQVKELEKARQGEKDPMNKYTVKQDSMQEQLAQLKSENLLPRQQFEDFQNKDTIKEKVVTDVPDRFNDIFSKLRSDTKQQVEMVEARNKELLTKCNHLREQVFKYEREKVEREGAFRRLQQELADSHRKQSTSEASLDVTTRYRNDLEEDNQQLRRELHRIKCKVDELSHQLEIQSARCTRVESANCDLQEQLLSMKRLHRNYEKLEKSKPHLEEDVGNLKRHIQSNLMDHKQIQQYKRDIEERARQEITQKLEEVNLFLQAQAASQEALEEVRATNNNSLSDQLEQRIRDLEVANEQENTFQTESTYMELERYKGLYTEAKTRRKSLESKLDRVNEKLAEANAKLLHERHRNNSLLANSFVSGSLSSAPVLGRVELGNVGTRLPLNRTLNLGGEFINPNTTTWTSRESVEAYLTRVRMELDLPPRN